MKHISAVLTFLITLSFIAPSLDASELCFPRDSAGSKVSMTQEYFTEETGVAHDLFIASFGNYGSSGLSGYRQQERGECKFRLTLSIEIEDEHERPQTFIDIATINKTINGEQNIEYVMVFVDGGFRHFGEDAGRGVFARTSYYLAASLVQGSLGKNGNYDMVAVREDGGLQHFWRNNDKPGNPWNIGEIFATEHTYIDVEMIQSNYGERGHFELIAVRADGGLEHFWRNNNQGAGYVWKSGAVFARDTFFTGVAFIQSNFGQKGMFEVVAVHEDMGMHHFWRNNDAPGYKWHPGVIFGEYQHFTDVTLIQGSQGTQGDFELYGAIPSDRSGFGFIHFWRDNDAPGLPWTSEQTRQGPPLAFN